jgi:hypothetical protein
MHVRQHPTSSDPTNKSVISFTFDEAFSIVLCGFGSQADYFTEGAAFALFLLFLLCVAGRRPLCLRRSHCSSHRWSGVLLLSMRHGRGCRRGCSFERGGGGVAMTVEPSAEGTPDLLVGRETQSDGQQRCVPPVGSAGLTNCIRPHCHRVRTPSSPVCVGLEDQSQSAQTKAFHRVHARPHGDALVHSVPKLG